VNVSPLCPVRPCHAENRNSSNTPHHRTRPDMNFQSLIHPLCTVPIPPTPKQSSSEPRRRRSALDLHQLLSQLLLSRHLIVPHLLQLLRVLLVRLLLVLRDDVVHVRGAVACGYIVGGAEVELPARSSVYRLPNKLQPPSIIFRAQFDVATYSGNLKSTSLGPFPISPMKSNLSCAACSIMLVCRSFLRAHFCA